MTHKEQPQDANESQTEFMFYDLLRTSALLFFLKKNILYCVTVGMVITIKVDNSFY